MEKDLRIGILLIQSLLGIRITVTDFNNENIILPSLYLGKNEKKIIREIIMDMPEKSICFLKDNFCVSYCIICIQSQTLMLGPYKNKNEEESDELNTILSRMHHNENLKLQFKSEYKKLVYVNDEQIKTAIHTLMKGIYGDLDQLVEKRIELRQYMNRLGIDTTELFNWKEGRLSLDIVQDRELSFQLISYVESGNFKNAIETYKELVRARIPEKGLGLDILEGLTTTRNLVEMAMHNAGVPIPAYAKLAREYQLKCRGISQKNDAEKLGYKFLNDSCELVRFYNSKKYSEYVSLVVDFIHQNLNESIALEEIAREVGLSPNRLSSLFHAEVGLTISNYVLEQRMIEAAKLLTFTNMDIQSIAAKIGIIDNNYFARCFKKYHGKTPTQFRKDRVLP